MPPAEREWARDPHHCSACGAAFEVAYFDDGRDEPGDDSLVPTDVKCPRCGKVRTLTLPAGAARTLVVESSANQADLGGGD